MLSSKGCWQKERRWCHCFLKKLQPVLHYISGNYAKQRAIRYRREFLQGHPATAHLGNREKHSKSQARGQTNACIRTGMKAYTQTNAPKHTVARLCHSSEIKRTFTYMQLHECIQISTLILQSVLMASTDDMRRSSKAEQCINVITNTLMN